MAIYTIGLEYDILMIPHKKAYKPGTVELTPVAKEFKNLVAHLTYKQARATSPIDPKKHWIEAFYVIHTPRILNEKKINLDHGYEDGVLKIFQDGVCDALGFDGAMITECHRKHLFSEKPRITLTLKVWGMTSFNDLHF